MVYFSNNPGFAQKVLASSEDLYRRIASDLGYSKASQFWTWNQRVKIYIHPDKASYRQAAVDQPAWSEGFADYPARRIVSYEWSKDFIESLLPHEIAHLIFRDFVQFEGDIPRWLDEGVAQWAEKGSARDLREKARQLYVKNSLLSIKDITRLNINLIDKQDKKLYFRGVRTKNGRVTLLVLSPDVLINTYYIEAGSLVSFLIERHGADRFTILCRELRDGKSLEEALSSAYAEHFKTVEDLEEDWRKYLEKS